MTLYTWPGNVRELLNVVERACSLADGDCIELGDLPEHIAKCLDSAANDKAAQAIAAAQPAPTAIAPAAQPAPAAAAAAVAPAAQDFSNMSFKEAKEEWLASFEGEYIRTLLERNGYNISQASRESEIDRKYFRKLMKKYGISADGADASDVDDD